MNNNRFKNYAMYVSLVGLVGLILQSYGLFAKLGLTDKTFNDIANGILTFLVAAGIINNPTTENKGYFDDSEK